MEWVLSLGVFVTICGGMFVFAAKTRQHRMARLAQWRAERAAEVASAARALQFSFTAEVATEQMARYNRFALFSCGRRYDRAAHAENWLVGSVAAQAVVMLDYFEMTENEGSPDVLNVWTAVLLPDGAAGLPNFELAPRRNRPSRIVKSLDQFLGKLFKGHSELTEVELADQPELTRLYAISGASAQAVGPVFRPEVIGYLEKAPGWMVEAKDGCMLLCRGPTPDLAAEHLRWLDSGLQVQFGCMCAAKDYAPFLADALQLQRLLQNNPAVRDRN